MDDSTHKYDDSDARFASLETNQVRFHEDFQRLLKTVEDLGNKSDSKHTAILAQIGDTQKTPWTTISTGAGVLLAIIIAVGSMNNSVVMESISSNTKSLNTIDSTITQIRQDGATVASVKSLEGTLSGDLADIVVRIQTVEALSNVNENITIRNERDLHHIGKVVDGMKKP